MSTDQPRQEETRRHRAPQGARIRRLLQALDVALGELRTRLHVPLAAGWRVLPLRAGPEHGRPALDLLACHRRHRPAAGGARLRRGRLAVPDRRRHLPVDKAALGQALRLDGGLGLRLGDARDHHGRGGIRHRLPRQPDQRPGHQRGHPWPLRPLPPRRVRDQLLRHEEPRSGRPDRPRRRAHRRRRPGPVPADLPAQAGVQRPVQLDGRRGQRQLHGRIPGRGAGRPLPVLRIRGLR